MSKNKKILGFVFLALVLFLLFQNRGVEEFMIFVFTLCIHEVFHVLTALFFGFQVDSISAAFFGLKLSYTDNRIAPVKSMFVYLSGPLANFIFALVLVFLSDRFTIPKAEFFIFYNLLFALINMIPAYPMDAARALTSLLNHFYGTVTSVRIMSYVSYLISLLMFFSGLYIFIFKIDNFLLMVMAIFVMLSTKRELESSKMNYLMGISKDAV